MKLISLNVCGLVEIVKQQQIRQFITENSLDVLFLQETNVTNTNLSKFGFKIPGYTVYNNPGPHRGSGIISIFSFSFPSTIIHKIIVPGFISSFHFTIEHKKFVLINSYIPNDQVLAKSIMESLDMNLTPFKDDCIILGGDFNCTLDPTLDRSTGVEFHNVTAKSLLKLITDFDLVDWYRNTHPTTKIFSKYSNTQYSIHGSRLDRFYISSMGLKDTKEILYVPTSASDHFTVQLIYNFSFNSTAYWIFSNQLLKNHSFVKQFTDFWNFWRTRKTHFHDLSQWWDVGKVYIKSMILESFSKPKYPSGNLTREFNKIASKLPNDPSLYEYYLSLKTSLQSKQRKFSIERLAQTTVKSFQTGTNPTGEFFKSVMERKRLQEIEYIRDTNGTLLTGRELENFLTNHYKAQFSDNLNVNLENTNYLAAIPKLTEEDQNDLEGEYSPEEIKISVMSLKRNTAPGLDGLTAEFYQFFQQLLMPDLLEIFNKTSTDDTPFPVTWTKQVIKLIPKPGDIYDINNWRPIILCNNDYKIITKLVSNRMKKKIGLLVHYEQSYCIPQRTIYDNIMTAKFMFDFHNKLNLPLAMVSIDQSKAFDNVSHQYLLSVLSNYNFPICFIRIIQKLYSNSLVLIKHRGKLLSNIKFSKGIRQGCPLSGMLYSLVIETFLFNLRINLNNIQINLPFSNIKLYSVNYADDILLFVNNNLAFPIIKNSLDHFGQFSGARVNYQKSTGLWCGAWKDRTDNTLDIQWTNTHIKYLGLIIGTADRDLNDQLIMTKLNRILSAWRERFKTLSLRSRVIVINYLITSSVFHILKVYTPDNAILKAMQGVILSAFWYGRRWIAEAVLYQPMVHGGFGLTNITIKASSFQLKNFQKIFTVTDTSFSKLFLPLIQLKLPNSGFNFIFIQPKPPFPDYWTTTVTDMCLKWSQYRTTFVFDPSLINYEELASIPLWHNPDVRDLATGNILHIPLYQFTCASFGDVIGHDGSSKIPIMDRDSRMIGAVVERAYSLLNQNSVNTSREALVHRDKKLINFSSVSSQEFYEVVLAEMPVVFHWKEKWKRFLDFDENSIKPNMKMFYYPPNESKSADISFKLFHHALPHPNQTSHFTVTNTRECNVCHQNDGTLYHRFFTCPVLNSIKITIISIIRSIKPNSDFNVNSINFITGPSVKSKENCLISFVLSTAKTVINEFFCDSTIIHQRDVVVSNGILKRNLIVKLKKRINVEFMSKKQHTFNDMWGLLAESVNNVLVYNF